MGQAFVCRAHSNGNPDFDSEINDCKSKSGQILSNYRRKIVVATTELSDFILGTKTTLPLIFSS